ncbi:cell division protein ZapA [Marinobacterium arenosum]|uniref:cell division protein ZapA n=1 Tax=Marinobacterium arenosum TaxID=2862496 RepID=UPI001C9376DA|nr:cell division protein ZapA [Marinobacterium arenosum]MBY4676902.1 cell division protein ZapA [Marinobacterium arenosum]
MSGRDARTVSVTLLGKEYMIACPEGSEAELKQAADYLNGKMAEIRGAGKTVGLERIAILAALNISHELVQQQARSEQQNRVQQQLQRLNARLDASLKPGDPDQH